MANSTTSDGDGIRRAHSILEIKSLDEDQRIVEGIASTPEVDNAGDVVEPRGAQFKMPLPFLWMHRPDQPVGHVVRATATDAGINVSVQIAKIAEPGTLKNRIDEAWQSLRSGLVRGLSIGFSSLESEPIANGGRRFKSWRWHELSAVCLPCNAAASIQVIKSIDQEALAALGRRTSPVLMISKASGVSDIRKPSPGAAGLPQSKR